THRGYAVKAVGRSKAGCVEQLRDLIDELLGQAQHHGRIGPDIRLGDVMAVAWAMRGIVETTGSVAPDAWQRHLDIHLAGLRAPGPQSTRDPVSREQLTQITGAVAEPGTPGR
ncbi:MAG TPA: hypothetical protein VGL02_29245, partial [Streptomyces sp.]